MYARFCHQDAIFRSPQSANFVKNQYFRHDGHAVFVISSVFRQKRNPLEPNYGYSWKDSQSELACRLDEYQKLNRHKSTICTVQN